ncbi:MAG: HD domain-containing protein [Candidatus Korarchaeota archaeon]|nr:HD domain-containing protein [Candidatus Korarchaeota archaeon]NIU84169.1 HD domain-containing protein [Candidatus Thorarchaeota archaeon]NIW14314.1 HD domain-containing protein [Candidatus Thorarchaeota archaeon]NIW52411.1 HD domain-containing protein [Candidatus Korarchaeota archaeon]
MIDFLLTLFTLKKKKRTGWTLHGIETPESIADHIFGTTFLAFLLANETYDVEKCIKLALVHDIHEAILGDLPSSRVSKGKKRKKEEQSFEILLSTLEIKKETIQELWFEYFLRKSKEAKFVRDMDKIEMIFQAFLYAKNYVEHGKDISQLNLDEFFNSAKEELSTSIGKKMFKTIKREFTLLD